MTSAELKEIVNQPARDAAVLGRLACGLKPDAVLEQSHADSTTFQVHWEDLGGYRRCTISSGGPAGLLARVDVHDNATVRVEARQPCAVTVCPEDDLLCLTRFRPEGAEARA